MNWTDDLAELVVPAALARTLRRVRDFTAPREACGAFLVEPAGAGRGELGHFEQLPNRAFHAEHAFELDPATFVDYCYRSLELARPGFFNGRYADSDDFPLVGLMHTHPHAGDGAAPSTADRQAARAIFTVGWIAFPWLVVAAGAPEFGAWFASCRRPTPSSPPETLRELAVTIGDE